MSTATAHPRPGQGAREWGPGRVAPLVTGSLASLIAFALLMAGLMVVLAHITVSDSAGFYTSPGERFATQTYALTSEGLQIGDIRGEGADWALDEFGATVRVRATAPDGRPLFIGIAAEAAVDRYLTQVRMRRSPRSTAARSPTTHCPVAAAPPRGCRRPRASGPPPRAAAVRRR